MRLEPRIKRACQLGFPPHAVADLYEFPRLEKQATLGIGLLELDGGYWESDVELFCKEYGFPVPPISCTGPNVPGQSDADDEWALDIQVVIGATRGLVPIRIYKAENKVSDFARAIRLCGKEGNCSALSISWGAPEKQYTETVDMESALQFTASQGISVFSASGDGGSSDGQDGDNADYPASSRFGCGVGGTTILKESPFSEAAWNSGGGGYSKLFKLPVWQSGNTAYDGKGFRGVPDVAANADPNTGYPIWVNGQKVILGGTSGAAPLWASLCAIFAELLGRKLGNIAPLLYAHQLDVPRPTADITAGSNGDFQTAVGWDPCTGLGTPIGGNMANLLGIKKEDGK